MRVSLHSWCARLCAVLLIALFGQSAARANLSELLFGDSAPIEVGGWTQLGYHSDSTAFTQNTGLSFNNRPDELNLHQQWFFLGKEADGSKGFDFGFRADFIYGIDGADTQAFGNPAGTWDFQNGFDHGSYARAIPQLYGEVAMGDLNVKIGHFFTIAGYETVTAPDNFFYSHSFTMFNSEPFTHTGVLASYDIGDSTLYGGWTAGWDTGFAQFNEGSSFLGGFAVPVCADTTLTYVTTFGNLGWRANNGYSHSIVLDSELTDDLNWVLQSDLVSADSQDRGMAGNQFLNDDSVGLNNYFFYTVNDWLRVGNRMEWWKSDGRSHYGYTSGANVLLCDNWVLRPEYRQQWAPAFNVDESIFGCDMVLTY